MKYREQFLKISKTTSMLLFSVALLTSCSTKKTELIVEPIPEEIPVIEYTGSSIIALNEEFKLQDNLTVYYMKDGEKIYLEDKEGQYFVDLYRYEVRFQDASSKWIDTKVPGIYEITVDAVNDRGVHKLTSFEIEVK